jgi:ferric-dicitrate binding protein FerR (iron transport regulator)
MIERESAADIEAQAVRWVVRADQGELTGADRTELDAWLAGDPRRQGAYVRAEAAWVMLDRAKALNGVPVETPSADRRTRGTARFAGGWARRRRPARRSWSCLAAVGPLRHGGG